MKTNFLLVVLACAALMFLGSCGEDEPKPATIAFDLEEEEVNESDGSLESFHPSIAPSIGVGVVKEVKLTLNRALSANAVIKYSITGTASQTLGDYSVDGSTLIIEKGATEAIIPVTIYEDFDFEVTLDGSNFVYTEDVTITLDEVVSGPIKLGEEGLSYKLNILEDDFYIELLWDPQDQAGENAGDVDMDLTVWLEDQALVVSEERSTEYEGLYIPAGFYEGTYSFSYTYYSGTSNDLDFYVGMYGYVNNDFYPIPDGYFINGTYTLQNKNAYDPTGDPPNVAIVQTSVKDGIVFKNVSTLTIPTTGSRIKSARTVSPELVSRFKDYLKTAKPVQLSHSRYLKK